MDALKVPSFSKPVKKGGARQPSQTKPGVSRDKKFAGLQGSTEPEEHRSYVLDVEKLFAGIDGLPKGGGKMSTPQLTKVSVRHAL